MFSPSARKFFIYGLAIAGAEEFITQGVLKGSYFLWIFTLVPFAIFLGVAGCLRATVHRLTAGWRAPLLYYLAAGEIGLAVEWYVIGLAPWRDQSSPLALVVVFHAGMFSFWGTVALAPHLLLDRRAETASIRSRFRTALLVLMAASYALTFAAKLAGASHDVQFLACIGPVVLTFLAMNLFYAVYFRRCGGSALLI